MMSDASTPTLPSYQHLPRAIADRLERIRREALQTQLRVAYRAALRNALVEKAARS